MTRTLRRFSQTFDIIRWNEKLPETGIVKFPDRYSVLTFLRYFMNDYFSMKSLRSSLEFISPVSSMHNYSDHEILEKLSWEIISGRISLVKRSEQNVISHIGISQQPRPGEADSSHQGIAAAGVIVRPDEKPVCEFTMFTLRCDHDQRSYVLDVINASPNKVNHHLIQVISEHDSPDTVIVEFGGSCKDRKDTCPSVKIDNLVKKDSPHKFEALYKSDREVKGFKDFLFKYMIPDPDALVPTEYTIRSSGCLGSRHSAMVQAFPSFKWAGHIGIGYDKSAADGLLDLGVEGEISGNIGRRNWSFASRREDDPEGYFPKLGPIIKDIASGMGNFLNAGEARKAVELGIKWPKVSLGGNMELMEARHDHHVGFAGEVFLKMDPLLGAEVNVDAIEMVFRWATKNNKMLSGYLSEIRERAEEGLTVGGTTASAKLAMDLQIKGNLGAALTWKKEAPDIEWSTEGKGTGSLTIELNGKVEGNVKGKVFTVGAGISAGIRGSTQDSGIGFEMSLVASMAKNKPAVGGEFTFTGMTIYYAMYAHVAVVTVRDNDAKISTIASSPGKRSKPRYQYEKKYEGNKEIWKAHIWPKRDKGGKNDPVPFGDLAL